MFNKIKRGLDMLGAWWCEHMHNDFSAVVHDRYTCWKCRRVYTVDWTVINDKAPRKV